MSSKKINHDNALGHLTGRSEFIEDRPMMKSEVFVSYYASPYARAKITARNYSLALDVEGILGVWDYRDLSYNRWGNIKSDQPLLAEEETSYFGEPVLVLAATSREALAEAKRLPLCEFEQLPALLSLEQAIKEGAFLDNKQVIERGDIDAGFKEAEYIIEGVYENGGQEHFYLESQVAIAYPVDGDEIDILSSTQNPTEIQHVVAKALGLSFRQVTAKVKRMGGAFGGKETQSVLTAVMAALAAYNLKRPARIALSKDEDMVLTGKRHPFKGFYKIGFLQSGEVTALETKLFSDGGAYTDISPAIMQRAVLHSDNAYYFKNMRVEGISCRTNHHPHTAFRGFGAPQGVALVEQAMDEVAFKLGIDPLEVRKVNLYRKGANITHYGQEVENNLLAPIIERLSSEAEYKKRKELIDKFNAKAVTKLKGIGLTPIKFGISFTARFLNQGNALVNIHLDGSVQISTGGTEMGQGLNTKIAQVVADTLGVEVEKCKVMITSTEKNHNTSPTAASSGSDLNAMAAHMATLKIKDRLLNLAAQVFKNEAHDAHYEYSYDPEVLTDHIVIKDSMVINSKSEQQMSLKELLSIAYFNRISLGDYAFYKTPNLSFDVDKGEGTPFYYYTQGAALSEVTIDRLTGKTKVERIDIVMDLGRPINEGLDKGQVAGAFVQCMGWVTNEKLVYSEQGELLTHSPTTYKIPNIQDIPSEFNIEFMDNPHNQKNIKGSKAVGEPPFVLGLSVWSAIRYALRQGAKLERNIAIPATNEEVLLTLED